MAAARSETTLKLVGDRELEITRVFRGPPRIVFEAWTRADLVAKWWAPEKRARMLECTADVKVGGKYRYVLQPHQGEAFAFSGEYLEVSPHSQLKYTHVFEPMAHAGSVVITVKFEAMGFSPAAPPARQGEHTLLTSREVYSSAEVRKIVLETGMEGGMREAMDQCDDLVLSLAEK
ncbi:MAG: SRPBCC domain-containing protein [Archangium sp.]|nr:SRPBCC domain-containing protein [Archangium sp.]